MPASARRLPFAPVALVAACLGVMLALPAAASAAASGTIDPNPASPIAGSVDIHGTATATTTVESISLAYSGPASGTVCRYTPTPPNWNCLWATSALPDGTYTLTLTVIETGGASSGPITRSVMVDNQPPSTWLDGFVEQANTQYQHAVGSTLFVNTAQGGSFAVRVAASDAGTGVDRVDFPGLGAGWTPTAGGSDVTPSYELSYSWSAGAASPGARAASAFDYAGNSTTASFSVEADTSAPTGGAISYPSSLSGPASVEFAAGSDAQSGIGSWQLQRRSAPLTADTCGAYGAWSNVGPAGAASPYSDVNVTAGTCYQYRLSASDNVGNQSVSASATTATYRDAPPPDTTAPAASLLGIVEGDGPAWQHVSGSTIYVNDLYGGSFTVRIAASDADSGIDRVDFPSLGTGWSPAGGSDAAAPWELTYSWTPALAVPGTRTAAVFDNAGNSTSVAFTVAYDASGPSGGSISYPASLSGAATVTFDAGSDAGSGIGSWQLHRRSAPIGDGACGAFGAWSAIGAANASSPHTDATVAAGNCYQWRLEVVDNIGNHTSLSGEIARYEPAPAPNPDPTPEPPPADTTAPTGTIAPVAHPASGVVTVSGTSADAASGVAQVQLAWRGATAGTICTVTAAPTSWSCAWDTRTLANGSYTLDLTVRDVAGNQAVVSAAATVTNPPGRVIRVGTAIADVLRGGAAADVLGGGGGNDRLFGAAGNDRLDGGAGNDYLDGGVGDDRLVGGPGVNTLIGGPGADWIDARNRHGRDTVRCGPGRDTVLADRAERVPRDCERVIRSR